MSNFIHHHSSSDPNIIRRSRGRRAAEYLLVALIAATVGVGAFIAPARAGDAHSGYASCAAGCHYIIDPLGDQTDPHDNPQGFCLRHNPDTHQM